MWRVVCYKSVKWVGERGCLLQVQVSGVCGCGCELFAASNVSQVNGCEVLFATSTSKWVWCELFATSSGCNELLATSTRECVGGCEGLLATIQSNIMGVRSCCWDWYKSVKWMGGVKAWHCIALMSFSSVVAMRKLASYPPPPPPNPTPPHPPLIPLFPPLEPLGLLCAVCLLLACIMWWYLNSAHSCRLLVMQEG